MGVSSSPSTSSRKMKTFRLIASAVVPLVLLVVCLPPAQSTIPLVVGTATVLTASQVSALVAIGLLVKNGALVKGGVAGASTRRRGKREAPEEEIFNIETIVELEEEQCYKRLFCAAASGELENKRYKMILTLLEKDQSLLSAPVSKGAEQIIEAARYGEIRKSVEKCENRYQCSLKLDVIDKLLQN